MDEFISLYEYFPDLVEKETAVIDIKRTGSNRLFAGEYLLLESYCNGKECDCRKVMLNVVPSSQPGFILATVGYCWETTQFYAVWAFGDMELARWMRGVYLEPMCIQSMCSETFLQLVKIKVRDKSFRLATIRHYKLFKDFLVKHD